MHAAKFLVAFAFGLTATLAQAAGFRFIEVPVRLPLTSRTKASAGTSRRSGCSHLIYGH